MCQMAMAQKPLPNIVSDEDFLGRKFSRSVFDIEMDSNGFAFFAGVFGLFRFNGFKLKVGFAASKTEHDAIFGIHKDFYGDLWFHNSLGLSYFDGDSIRQYELPDSLNSRFRVGLESFYRDSNGTLHIAPRGHGYFTISNDGHVKEVIGRSSGIHGFGVTVLEDGTPFQFYISQKGRGSGGMDIYHFDQQQMRLLTHVQAPSPLFESSLVRHSDGSYFLSMGRHDIIQFSADTLISHTHFAHEVIKLFADSRGDLWVGTFNGGLFRANQGDLENLDCFLPRTSSAVVAEDQDGGLWLKSDSIGFGYLPQPSIPHYSARNGFAHFQDDVRIIRSENGVYALVHDEGIFKFQGDSIAEVPLPKEGGRLPCYDPTTDKLWVTYEGGISSWDGEKWTALQIDTNLLTHGAIVNLKRGADGRLLGATRREVFEMSEGQIKLISDPSQYSIQGFAVDSSGKVWVGCHDGLWVLEGKQFVRPFDPMPEDLKRPPQSLFFAQNAIWVQPATKPLYKIIGTDCQNVLDSNGQKVMTEHHTIAPNGDVWMRMGSASGTYLCRIRNGLAGEEVSYFAFDDRASWGSREASFEVTDKKVYSGSDNGLFVDEIANLQPENRTIKLVIEQVYVNRKAISNKRSHHLSYEENDLYIDFDGVNFRRLPHSYRHRLVGQDSVWFKAEFPQVQYTNLAPGDYQFEVQARLNEGKWGSSKTVEFHISPPFWQEWWFLVGVFIGVGLLFMAALYFRSRYVLSKEQRKSKAALEMAGLELRALKAQINPHFIFNAISSVLYYMSKHNTPDARSYLERFAQLIRTVLENSESSKVSLDNELQLMRHYISLESERFHGEPIEFQVSFERVDPKRALISPALFQPYIENSIWHGLKHKSECRRIAMHFARNDNQLAIEIEDNGIGRKRSQEMATGHKEDRSFGMMISSRRISVLNGRDAQQVHVIDLKDEHNNATGTRVMFSIPYESVG